MSFNIYPRIRVRFVASSSLKRRTFEALLQRKSVLIADTSRTMVDERNHAVTFCA